MNPIVYAIPVFMLSILLEAALARWQGRAVYGLADAISSLHLGVLSQVVGSFIKLAALAAYVALYQLGHLTNWALDDPWAWLLALLLYDFCYYWHHRLSHTVNLLWAAHVVHHSSEHYNLTTALRQTASGALLSGVFYLPLALLGVPPLMLVSVGLIDLLYQYWVHTELIGRLGWLDRVFVTPSNHRVHHGQNDYCLDKNYGGVLIVFDRLFGTYATERADEPPRYGIRSPLRSFNPLWGNLHHYARLWRASRQATGWRAQWRVWFGPPAALDEAGVPAAGTPAATAPFSRYDPPTRPGVKPYVALHYALLIGPVAYFLAVFDRLDRLSALGDATLLVTSLLSLSALLDGKAWGWWLERVRLLGLGLLALAGMPGWGLEWPLSARVALALLAGASVWALVLLKGSPPPHDPPEPAGPSRANARARDSLPMPGGRVILLLSLMLGLQPISTDLYLPALPSLRDSLGASVSQTQLTLSTLLLCFGLSQLVFGPLSDRWGRRPVLLLGLSLYTLAALGNALAPSIEWLIATRAVQGAAMGAVVMCARAIIRDLYAPAEGAHVMASAMGGLGVIACLSPLLGGLLVPLVGWRWALMVLVLFGGASLGLVWLRFSETLARPNLQALHLRGLWRNAQHILGHARFQVWAALLAASYAGLFTFLAASPFVFLRVYGVSLGAYGLAMASASVAYIAGTRCCHYLVPRVGPQAAVRVAALLSLSGGSIMGVLAWLGVHTWWAFLLPQYLFMAGHGIHQPCVQTGAVAAFPQMAGTASALAGCLLTLVAFGVGAWLGWRIDGTVFPLVNGVWFWSAIIATLAWTVVRTHGAPSGTA